jgi:hypothetical protein
VQCGDWGIMPWWGNTMYSRDYFALIDKFGADKRLFVCPTVAPESGDGIHYGDMNSPSQTEDQCRQAASNLDSIGIIPPNAFWRLAKIGNTDSPDSPVYDPAQGWGGCGGVYDYIVQFSSYTYCGWNNQFSPGRRAAYIQANPYASPNLDTNATMPAPADNTNPPLMCDMTWYQASPTKYIYNHGTRWTVPSIDPTTHAVSPGHVGDVRINVLYRDGHVDGHAPGLTSYLVVGGPAYFFW